MSSAGLGEPIITLEKVHLPVHYGDGNQGGNPSVAWDFNLLSLDGYSPETGWIRIDTKKLASVHTSSFEKRRSVQRKASKSKKARRILAKYSNRERKEPRGKTPARNCSCNPVGVWFCGPRRAQKAGHVHALACVE